MTDLLPTLEKAWRIRRRRGEEMRMEGSREEASLLRWRAKGWRDRVGIACISVAFLLSLALGPSPASQASSSLDPGPAELARSAHTPAPGSSERRAILEALRPMVPEIDGSKVVFVVRYLRVFKGWSWIEADPESADGRNRFEPLHCLLRKVGDRWVVMEVRPCCGDCEDDPDCRDRKRYFRKLRSRFPQAPADIFPRE